MKSNATQLVQLFDQAHRLARWIGMDQFKIDLPIQSRDWIRYNFDFPQARTVEEAKQCALVEFQKNPNYKKADESSIEILVDARPKNAPKPLHFSVRVNWEYRKYKKRECTFQTVGAIEVPNEYEIPDLRTFKLLGCSRGQNSWGKSMWFYAATIGDKDSPRPVSAIKEDSMEAAVKLCQQRAKRKVLKSLRA